jgi:GH25 family lysozyme M1 (1,4-beta-N-acetylmuramidase)
MILRRTVTMCAVVLAFSLVTVTAAGAFTSPAGTGRIRGIDVSSYQHMGHTINWRLLAREGIKFVAIKVSEGTYYTNPYYAGDARAAAAAGLSVVPYVFANPRRSPGAKTARFAVAAAGYTRGTGRLPLEVDLENDPYAATDGTGNCYGLSVQRMIAWIAGFNAEAMALTGKAPIIYTAVDWWQQCTRNTALFRHDPLWLASYDTTRPAVPPPWTTWTFWQYSDDTELPGVGVTDVDYYQATSALPALRPPSAKAVSKSQSKQSSQHKHR